MENLQERINELSLRLSQLFKQQSALGNELMHLANEIGRLQKLIQAESNQSEIKTPSTINTAAQEIPDIRKVSASPISERSPASPVENKKVVASSPNVKSTFEEFIGGNIASKVGILVTIVGVFIGAKYSIDRNLISPAVRILLGYLIGFLLVGTGWRLKKKYQNFSAVLVGGGLSVFYFTTYIAYSFYSLLPQQPAFIIMVVFTVITVYAAIIYNRAIIAHLALVGAYGIPFLLSDGSGRYDILFSYMTILNSGVLILSLRKYWKSLFYASFFISWLIYFFWFISAYDGSRNWSIAWTFLSLFFAIFYITFLAYKLIKKEKYGLGDVVILLINSSIFYGIGYWLLNSRSISSNWLGLFTILNAAIHVLVCIAVNRLKLADKSLFYFLTGLAIVFLTIAIPVQFKGNWITLLWAGEAVLMCRIGKTRQVKLYELLSIPLATLSFMSLLSDWAKHRHDFDSFESQKNIIPFFNINFTVALIAGIAFGYMIFLSRKYAEKSSGVEEWWRQIWKYALPIFFLVISYFTFFFEIEGYFTGWYYRSAFQTTSGVLFDENINRFSELWLLHYSMVYFAIAGWTNYYRLQNKLFGSVVIFGIVLVLAIFLTRGFYVCGELRDSFLLHASAKKFTTGIGSLLIHYFSVGLVFLLLFVVIRSIKKLFWTREFIIGYHFLFHICVLIIISNEFINWMDIGGYSNQYKLGLSIIWGLYALYLVVLGIWKKKKYYRLGAILLFAITLAKLFFYDIVNLSTISKTIVLISLGIILLVVSYLYNRYKHVILMDDQDGL